MKGENNLSRYLKFTLCGIAFVVLTLKISESIEFVKGPKAILMNLFYSTSARKFLFIAGIIIFFLIGIDLILLNIGFRYNAIQNDGFSSLFHLFDIDDENNFPTLFSVLDLFLSSMLLLVIGKYASKIGSKYYRYWYLLAFIFFFLGVDEGVCLHERTNSFVRPLIGAEMGDSLYRSWVIPYGILTLGIGILFLRFLISLPRWLAIGFVASGSIFILGAIGLEIVGSSHDVLEGHKNYTEGVFSAIEEMLEMVGIALFNYFLIRYMEVKKISFQFSFLPDEDPQSHSLNAEVGRA